jgi:uncharacterized Zn-binding protein involved in type VI secretion
MSKPAARVGDMHTCPMVTPGTPPIPHVGGPIAGPCVPTVLIGGLPAAVVGDMCVCVGPPDTIVMGSTGVLIGGKPATRMGDNCAHGGVIVAGLPTALIGMFSAVLVAINMLSSKLIELNAWDEKAKANVKKWMGDDSEATRNMLTKRIEKQIEVLNRIERDNFKEASPKNSDCFAYVYPTDKTHTIYLGKHFHPAPETGSDSKAGTLIHEVSHFNDVAGTDDVVYGTDNAENLAQQSPSDAKKNADNFEYYIEH